MDTEEIKKKTRLTPTQTLVIGIIFVILIGAVLLKLPISNNKPIKFIDSLFVSTTSVCVTGLTTVVIAEQFTVFGQVVIMCLIQIGGLRIYDIYITYIDVYR
jgi:trk system potassium uptake protein TrkH